MMAPRKPSAADLPSQKARLIGRASFLEHCALTIRFGGNGLEGRREGSLDGITDGLEMYPVVGGDRVVE